MDSKIRELLERMLACVSDLEATRKHEHMQQELGRIMKDLGR